MDFEKPTYNTFQPDAVPHAFKSVITLNGKSYTGEPGKNKKEAEQFAARAAILSLLGKNTQNLTNDIVSNDSRRNMCC